MKKLTSIVNIFSQNGIKKSLNTKHMSLIASLILATLIFITAVIHFSEDTSVVANTHSKMHVSQEIITPNIEDSSSHGLHAPVEEPLLDDTATSNKAKPRAIPLKLKAKQVISRDGVFDDKTSLPLGFEAPGILLTSIDTRDQSAIYKVTLPKGASFRGHKQFPDDTILIGHAVYGGNGPRVQLNLDRAVLETGDEIKISAQALDTGKRRPGIAGNYHGNVAGRVFASIGLTAISGAADVLSDKIAVGDSGQITERATTKNAVLGGVSAAAEKEANRQFSEISSEKPYVTVDAGQEIVIQFNSSVNTR